MKTQKLKFALTSLHNLQKKNQKLIKKRKNKTKLSNSDNKSKQESTNIDI